MDQISGMDLGQRLHQRKDLPEDLLGRNRVRIQDRAQIRAVQIFHDDIDRIIGFKKVKDIHDAGDVFQLPEHLCLLQHLFFSFFKNFFLPASGDSDH